MAATAKGTARLGVAVPQTFPDGKVDMGVVREAAVAAERLGYHSLWVLDSTISRVPFLEAIGLLSYAAALTSRIRLGTAVIVSTERHPVHLAKALSTLDNLSGGRVIAGVGLGGRDAYRALFGIPAEGKARFFAEGIEVMKALWTQDSARYDGRFWRLEGPPMEPKPVQKPYPPLWFGARHPNALRRAVRHGDGWIGAGSASIAEFREQAAIVRRCLEEAGRDPAAFPIAKRVYLAVDPNAARAERRLREWFGAYYGDADMAERVAVWGSADRCVERLSEIVAAGAHLLHLNQVFDDVEHVEAIAAQVAPHLAWGDAPFPLA